MKSLLILLLSCSAQASEIYYDEARQMWIKKDSVSNSTQAVSEPIVKDEHLKHFHLMLGGFKSRDTLDFSSVGGGMDTIYGGATFFGVQAFYEDRNSIGDVGIEVNGGTRGSSTSVLLIPHANTVTSGYWRGILAFTRLRIGQRDKVHGFISGGAGGSQDHFSMTVTPQPGFFWTNTFTNETRTFAEGDSFGLLYMLGLGLDFPFKQFGIGIEGRYQGSSTRHYDATAAAVRGGITGITGPTGDFMGMVYLSF